MTAIDLPQDGSTVINANNNTTTAAVKFFYNGIKVDGMKLQKCSYSLGELRSFPKGTITIYAKNYRRFEALPVELVVTNDSDSQNDLFCDDIIRVTPDNVYYGAVLAACRVADMKHDAMRLAARERALAKIQSECAAATAAGSAPSWKQKRQLQHATDCLRMVQNDISQGAEQMTVN